MGVVKNDFFDSDEEAEFNEDTPEIRQNVDVGYGGEPFHEGEGHQRER